jgi:hypothetical protein
LDFFISFLSSDSEISIDRYASGLRNSVNQVAPRKFPQAEPHRSSTFRKTPLFITQQTIAGFALRSKTGRPENASDYVIGMASQPIRAGAVRRIRAIRRLDGDCVTSLTSPPNRPGVG